MNRPAQSSLFADAQPRTKGVMPDAEFRKDTTGSDPRARRGKRALSKAHASHAITNREAARIVLATGKYQGALTEWAMRVMEKNKCLIG